MRGENKSIEKPFTLRYKCETDYCKSFTGSKKVASRDDADHRVAKMLAQNEILGYTKYSGFKLYDQKNNIVIGF